jgi:TRAP-type C4-dicarboxylate transport system substrate-binding protein
VVVSFIIQTNFQGGFKMKKRENSKALIGSAYLAVALAVFSLIIGLALPTSTEAQSIKLKYGSYGPQSVIDDPVLWYINEVSKRSGTKIEVETYFGGILAKPADCLDAIGTGVYQIGWISPVFTPGRTPLATIPNGTPLVVPTLTVGCKAADELIRTFPPAAAEYEKANVKYLFQTGIWQYDVICRKPIKTLEDIKGLRIRTFGYLSKAWAELGGTPVMVPISEAYDNLQKGSVDGVAISPFSLYKGLRLYEVAKYFTKFDLGCLPTPVLMNMAAFNKLPQNVRKAMLEVAKEMPAKVDEIISRQELAAIEGMKKDGVTEYELSASDKARIREVGKSIVKTVVDDLTSKGVSNAKEAMDIYLAAIQKYSK